MALWSIPRRRTPRNHRPAVGTGILGHAAAQLDALVEHPHGNPDRVLELLDLAVQYLVRSKMCSIALLPQTASVF